MSNLQLFLAAGLPTVSVLLGILLSQRSTEKLEKRIDSFEQRTDTRFGASSPVSTASRPTSATFIAPSASMRSAWITSKNAALNPSK